MKKSREELLALLADMSIEEKAGQLAQIPIVACMDGVSEPTGPMEELSLTPEQVVLSSVNMEHLRMARRVSDRVFLHHIFSDEVSIKELAQMKPAGVSLNYQDLDAFDHRWVDVVHGYGLKLCLRAGDSSEQVERMKALGLDYIPTNCFKPEWTE